jgi:hypothetical protein
LTGQTIRGAQIEVAQGSGLAASLEHPLDVEDEGALDETARLCAPPAP